ncbi:hypothetical protein [Pseudomonas pseudonitroreducens]|uniref:hypothetical protein n=1 Tax=Pseudomonas pseudonitroreducens TaxID=2892326 RepID=UPI001F1C3F2B|nr:hypothetical protein [Pseudomonas pseudonitroreducens]
MEDKVGTQEAQHRKWMANFFCGKVKELEFHLKSIVEGCDTSLSDHSALRPHDERNAKSVIYGFSSLSNCIQSMKDSSSAILSTDVTWADIKKCRHGEFFYLSRNAATHDGNPVVSMWADGKFYVPQDIIRFDNRGDLVVIPAPEDDVRVFCLEFCLDFAVQFKARMTNSDVDADVINGAFDINELKGFMESDKIPQFAKDLFDQNMGSIEASLKEAKFNPAHQAVSALDSLIEYCNAKLA